MQEPEGRFVPAERGFAKGRALQVLFHDLQEDDALYITHGVRSDKPDKAQKEVAERVRHLVPHSQISPPGMRTSTTSVDPLLKQRSSATL